MSRKITEYEFNELVYAAEQYYRHQLKNESLDVFYFNYCDGFFVIFNRVGIDGVSDCERTAKALLLDGADSVYRLRNFEKKITVKTHGFAERANLFFNTHYIYTKPIEIERFKQRLSSSAHRCAIGFGVFCFVVGCYLFDRQHQLLGVILLSLGSGLLSASVMNAITSRKFFTVPQSPVQSPLVVYDIAPA